MMLQQFFVAYSRFQRRKRALIFGIAALICAILLFGVLPQPVSQTFTHGNATLTFQASSNLVFFPWQCVDVKWDVEGIKAFYINKLGRIGHDQAPFCDVFFQRPHALAYFADSTRVGYLLDVRLFQYNPLALILAMTLALILLLLCYNTLGFWACVVIVTVAATSWMALDAVWFDRYNDYLNHTLIAERIAESGVIYIPHFLFHLTDLFLTRLIPSLTLPATNFIIFMSAYTLTSVFIYLLWRNQFNQNGILSKRSLLIYLCIPALFYVSPLNNAREDIYSWYIYANLIHNPTFVFLKPFMAGVLFYLALLLSRPRQQFKWITPCLAIFAVLATIAKPSYTLPLVAATIVMIGLDVLMKWNLPRWQLVIGLVVPSLLILLWQYQLVYSVDQVKLYTSETPASIRFAPLSFFLDQRLVGLDVMIPQLISPLAFPIFVYLAYWRRAVRNPLFTLSSLAYLAALALGLLFIEYPFAHHGNLLWSARITLFALFAVSIAFFVQVNDFLLKGKFRLPRDVRFYLASGLLLLHIIPIASWNKFFAVLARLI